MPGTASMTAAFPVQTHQQRRHSPPGCQFSRLQAGAVCPAQSVSNTVATLPDTSSSYTCPLRRARRASARGASAGSQVSSRKQSTQGSHLADRGPSAVRPQKVLCHKSFADIRRHRMPGPFRVTLSDVRMRLASTRRVCIALLDQRQRHLANTKAWFSKAGRLINVP